MEGCSAEVNEVSYARNLPWRYRLQPIWCYQNPALHYQGYYWGHQWRDVEDLCCSCNSYSLHKGLLDQSSILVYEMFSWFGTVGILHSD